MKFFNQSNTFIATIAYFAKYIQYRWTYYRTTPVTWFHIKVLALASWFITATSIQVTDSGNVAVEIEEEYEDYWTEQKPMYSASVAFPPTERVSLKISRYPFIKMIKITEPAKVQQLPVLANSEEEAWDTLEKYLWDNEDYETTILAIQKTNW